MGQPMFLQADIRNLNLLDTARTHQDIDFAGTDMPYQGQVLDPSSDKLIDKSHGMVMDGKTPDMDTGAVRDQTGGF